MLTLNVKEYQKVEGQANTVRLIDEHHHLILSQGGVQVFCQHGEVYTGENTAAIKYNEIPEWVWELARKASLEARRVVGLVLPEELSEAETEEKKVPEARYECPESDCLASVPMNNKGLHIGMHTRKRNAAKKKIVETEKKSILDKSIEAAAEDGIVYTVEK